MKTIEQLLRPVIKTDIQYLLNLENKEDKYTLLLTENFNMQNKMNTEYTIQAITQSGQGALTQLPNVKAVQTPLSIVFQIPVNYQRDFIKVLNTYILATNAVWSQVIDDLEDNDALTQEAYQYRLIWRSPIVSGSPYDIQVKSDKYDADSISVIQIVLVGEVIHTSSFAMNDEELYLFCEDVDTYVNAWKSSNESAYNAAEEDMKSTVVNLDTYPAIPTGYEAANYELGHVLRVSNGILPEEFTYYSVGQNIITTDRYVLIEGIVSENEPLSPIINQTELVEQYLPEKDISGDSQTLNLSLAVQTSNPLHEKLLRLYYSNRTSTSFDIKMKRVRKSLSITQTDIDMIMSLNRSIQNGFEYLGLTLTRK